MQIGNTNLGEKPILLAPMEDITDSAFRAICRKFGADMVYSEFVSSEAIIRNASKTIDKMLFFENEKPIGIQLFGNNVDAMTETAKIISEINPNIIDINFGCPVRKIAMKGSGAALLKDIPLMIKISESIVKAVKIPVTVKTRLGWDNDDKPIESIVEQLQDVGVQAVTIHGRTRNQMYSGNADWTLIGKIKNNPRIKIPIIGNGDITDAFIAKEKFETYGVDAIMIGRASIGNPWIFSQIKKLLNNEIIDNEITIDDRISTCLEHLKLAIERKGDYKAIIEMRKHYSGYFKSVANFKKTRLKLVTATNLSEIEDILNSYSTSLYC